jgi:flavin reductase (DIM6/NTAB) family NADH-FMN oxidoreductase RutF
MFYEAAGRVGERCSGPLPYDPIKAIVAPRPVGWLTTVSSGGVVNLAPYSFFNAVADKPAVVAFGSDGRKHSARNAGDTGAFVCNVATWDLREAVNATSVEVAADVSEAHLADLELAPSRLVAPPRVAAAPAALECVHLATHPLRLREGEEHGYVVVYGQVVGVHVDDRFIRDGRVDTAAMRPIARMGYDEYTVVERAFRMRRPR